MKIDVTYLNLLKFVPKCSINDKPALVQITAWCQIGNKTNSEPVMAQFTDANTQPQWVKHDL